jgi:hypothetical protein
MYTPQNVNLAVPTAKRRNTYMAVHMNTFMVVHMTSDKFLSIA